MSFVASKNIESTLITALTRLLGADNVTVDGPLIDLFSCDFGEEPKARIGLIARPAERSLVAEVLKLAHAADCPVCVRGGGMSYTQGYLPDRPGTLLLDMSALNRIVEINLKDLYITVETGCTWQQIYHVLDGTGYHLPFGGTMSGERATIGGALANNATAVKRGQVVDDLLGLEVVLADGRVIQTGSRATGRPVQPMRNYGPDLTGLFLNDAGIMGVKTQATFRLERRPRGTEFAAFGFQDTNALIDAMCALAREGLATENMAFGAYHNQMFAAEPRPTRTDVSALVAAVKAMAGNRFSAYRLLAKMARPGGMKFLGKWKHTLVVSTDGYTPSIARTQMREIKRIAKSHQGAPLPPTLAIAMRALPFHPVERLIVGTGTKNNTLPSNRFTSLSHAHALYEAAENFLLDNRALMQRHGLTYTILFACVSNNMFGIEPIIYWRDSMTPLRAHILSQKRRDELLAIPEDLTTRGIVVGLRRRMVARLADIPGAHYQIGKYYNYKGDLADAATLGAICQAKLTLDKSGILNPGGLWDMNDDYCANPQGAEIPH